jgi:hypothetical protein
MGESREREGGEREGDSASSAPRRPDWEATDHDELYHDHWMARRARASEFGFHRPPAER